MLVLYTQIGLMMVLGGVDNGLTFHPEAARSDPAYQGQGLMATVTRDIMAEFETKWPHWKYVRSTSTHTDYYDTLTDRVDILTERVIHLY